MILPCIPAWFVVGAGVVAPPLHAATNAVAATPAVPVRICRLVFPTFIQSLSCVCTQVERLRTVPREIQHTLYRVVGLLHEARRWLRLILSDLIDERVDRVADLVHAEAESVLSPSAYRS